MGGINNDLGTIYLSLTRVLEHEKNLVLALLRHHFDESDVIKRLRINVETSNLALVVSEHFLKHVLTSSYILHK
jgi:hypothetical protein